MDNLISRQAAIDAIAKMMPESYTPDGSHPADEGIFAAQEIFSDCIAAIEILPSVQPDVPDTNVGKWIISENGNGTCSKCCSIQVAVWDYEGWQNFCGKCGAKMEGIEGRSET